MTTIHREQNYRITHACVCMRKDSDLLSIADDMTVTVQNGIITDISHSDTLSCSTSSLVDFDAQGKTLGPAPIEFHIHGCGGFDTSAPTDDSTLYTKIRGMYDFLCTRGITHFQPTLVMDMISLCGICDALAADTELAQAIPSVYIEGPFINPEKKGGIPASSLAIWNEPGKQLLEAALAVCHPLSGKPLIGTMTLAMELEGAEEIEHVLCAKGIRVAYGHSTVSASTIRQSYKQKKSKSLHITHLCNAMNGLDHRNPGLALVPFVCEKTTYELICDGVHVHPDFVEMLIHTLGTKRLCLISDAMAQAGMGSGEMQYMGQTVVCDAVCSRYKESGVLIGSARLIPESARDLYKRTIIGRKEFFRITAENPASLLGLESEYGAIQNGMKAHMVLADETFTLTDVFF